jgi:hypothetical protein
MCTPVVLKDGTTWSAMVGTLQCTFGYCWELIKPEGKNDWIYTKSGEISGFLNYVLYFPRADVTIVLCANSQGRFRLFDLGLEIADAMEIVK